VTVPHDAVAAIRQLQILPLGDEGIGCGVAGRLRCLAKARPFGAAIRVRVGGWGLPAGANGRDHRMHAGADRRHARGQERTRRLPDRGAGERAELARTPATKCAPASDPLGAAPAHKTFSGATPANSKSPCAPRELSTITSNLQNPIFTDETKARKWLGTGANDPKFSH
jgi:hypothetical protein